MELYFLVVPNTFRYIVQLISMIKIKYQKQIVNVFQARADTKHRELNVTVFYCPNTFFILMLIKRLIIPIYFLICRNAKLPTVVRPRMEFRDRDLNNFTLNIETKTETENVKVSMSRPRLIETLIFQSCQDRDSARLQTLEVVETETHRDWAKVVETETFLRVSLFTELVNT